MVRRRSSSRCTRNLRPERFVRSSVSRGCQSKSSLSSCDEAIPPRDDPIRGPLCHSSGMSRNPSEATESSEYPIDLWNRSALSLPDRTCRLILGQPRSNKSSRACVHNAECCTRSMLQSFIDKENERAWHRERVRRFHPDLRRILAHLSGCAPAGFLEVRTNCYEQGSPGVRCSQR